MFPNPRNISEHVALRPQETVTHTAGGTTNTYVTLFDRQALAPKFTPLSLLLGLYLNGALASAQTCDVVVKAITGDSALDGSSDVIEEFDEINLVDGAATAEDKEVNYSIDLSAAKRYVGFRITSTFSAANTDTMKFTSAAAFAGFDRNMSFDEFYAEAID